MATESNADIRHALIDNYNAYAEGLDTHNWDLVRSCFADKVCIDYGAVSDPTGTPDVARNADDWILVLRSVIDGFDITRHTITNHRVVISDEEVSCQAYLIADHVIFPEDGDNHLTDEHVVTVVGEYTNHYEQTGGGWKICRSKLVFNWTRGNLALMALAGERAASQS